MKKYINICIVLCTLLCSLGTAISGCGSSAVAFPDHDLNLLIRDVLHKPEGPINPWELEEITTLQATKTDVFNIVDTVGRIEDLTGLESCINLKELYLDNNPLMDITPLAKLKKLETVSMMNCGITDISPLASCSMIENLILMNNEITDISPLSSMVNMKTLMLSGNRITDISSLAQMTSMESLYLYDNRIEDISAVSAMRELTILMMGPFFFMGYVVLDEQTPGGANFVSDLTPLTNLQKLKHLYLNANMVEDITPLGYLTNLETVSLHSNLITDISAIANMKYLTDLNVSYNKLDDLSPILDLPALEKVILIQVEQDKTEEGKAIIQTLKDRDVQVSSTADYEILFPDSDDE